MAQTHFDLKDWLIVVPARLGSTRLPEKPLQDLAGKPLIIRVAENLKALSDKGASIVIATDSEKVKKICAEAGYSCVLTDHRHESGTDRCWEVASGRKEAYVLNVQGDEPFVAIDALLKLMADFAQRTEADIGTLVVERADEPGFKNPNVVKAVASAQNMALYFSRAPVPYARDAGPVPQSYLHHQGVYAYRRESLKQFCHFPPSKLEQTERLEQLRALENGMSILLVRTNKPSVGIDTAEDLEAARARFK